MLKQEPRGQKLIKRYKENYEIPPNIDISEEMILKHWNLERSLTKQLIESTFENRWETFERCYSTLFAELFWLNISVGTAVTKISSNQYSIWTEVIGDPPLYVYEIGSGKGGLINYLANSGYVCKGTEITRQRGERYVPEHSKISWGISDGVHLNQFEKADTFDVVISNQVIEHIHPDDLLEHFNGVRTILTKGGRYIFTTPHKYFGPSDISRVFNCDKPEGMHLKEYTYREINEFVKKSGFKKISAVQSLRRINRFPGLVIKTKSSSLLFYYFRMVEKFISVFPKQTQRRKIAIILKYILFKNSMFIVIQK